jgi:hypothetical protein
MEQCGRSEAREVIMIAQREREREREKRRRRLSGFSPIAPLEGGAAEMITR